MRYCVFIKQFLPVGCGLFRRGPVWQVLAGRILALFGALWFTGGCARFSNVQIETRTDGTRFENRLTATEFFDSNNGFSKFRSSVTDKTKTLSIGGFEGEASGTNALELIGRISAGATEGAIKAFNATK